MLEIENNKENKISDFPKKMVEIQTETTKRIVDLCFKHNLDPFAAMRIFGANMIQTAAEMRAHFESKHSENKDGDESNKS